MEFENCIVYTKHTIATDLNDINGIMLITYIISFILSEAESGTRSVLPYRNIHISVFLCDSCCSVLHLYFVFCLLLFFVSSFIDFFFLFYMALAAFASTYEFEYCYGIFRVSFMHLQPFVKGLAYQTMYAEESKADIMLFII